MILDKILTILSDYIYIINDLLDKILRYNQVVCLYIINLGPKIVLLIDGHEPPRMKLCEIFFQIPSDIA